MGGKNSREPTQEQVRDRIDPAATRASQRPEERTEQVKDQEATRKAPTSVEVHVHSSKTQVEVTVLDKQSSAPVDEQGSYIPKVTSYVARVQHYDSVEWTVDTRGIHVIVIDRTTGKIVECKVFDTWVDGRNSAALVKYLDNVPVGKVLCFAVLDEGSSHLEREARKVISSLGSKSVSSLGFREMWAFVTVKGGKPIGEAIQAKQGEHFSDEWAPDVNLRINLPLI